MKSLKVYTGTSDEERVKFYREGVFVIPAHLNGNKLNHDPGDLGSGCYCDTRLYRARFYGKYLFRLTLDASKILDLGCPYGGPENLSQPWLKPLFYDENGGMKTVQLPKDQRIKAAEQITRELLKRGYLGARWGSEVVLFSNDVVLEYVEIKRNGRAINDY